MPRGVGVRVPLSAQATVIRQSLFCASKGTRSVGGGVAVLSALVECAELLRNFGISFEKYLLKRVWHLFSTNLPNLRFSCTLSSLAMLKPAATVRACCGKRGGWMLGALGALGALGVLDCH